MLPKPIVYIKSEYTLHFIDRTCSRKLFFRAAFSQIVRVQDGDHPCQQLFNPVPDSLLFKCIIWCWQNNVKNMYVTSFNMFDGSANCFINPLLY